MIGSTCEEDTEDIGERLCIEVSVNRSTNMSTPHIEAKESREMRALWSDMLSYSSGVTMTKAEHAATLQIRSDTVLYGF